MKKPCPDTKVRFIAVCGTIFDIFIVKKLTDF